MFDRFDDQRAVKWAKAIKDRDNWICQVCKRYGVPLNSHHLNSWDTFEEQRYDLNNGITLCQECHDRFHAVYGKGKNTRLQFLQFCKTLAILKESYLKQQKE